MKSVETTELSFGGCLVKTCPASSLGEVPPE
jgi:hypothetical protein